MLLEISLADGFSSSLECTGDHARWRVGELEVTRGATSQVLSAYAQCIGMALRDWPPSFRRVALELIAIDGYDTARSNAVKAVGLFAVWLEPMVLSGGEGVSADSLSSEVIVDYTGAPGQQPYIYVLSSKFQKDDDAHARLYELGLLSRLTVTIDSKVLHWWFKPLVTPIVRLDRLGASERLWSGIKNEMQAAVRRAAGGHQ